MNERGIDMKISYLMIKPDGLRYLFEIEQLITTEGFEICGRYSVYNWEEVAKQIYAKSVSEHDEVFEKEFLGHIWLNKYLFGNYAIVILLRYNNLENKQLLEQIMRLKLKIRKRFNASKNGTFIVALDMNKINLTSDLISSSNLVLQTENGIITFDDNISQCGKFSSFYFQYVHCPDPIVDEAQNELTILKRMAVISEHNLICDEEWNKIKCIIERLGESV